MALIYTSLLLHAALLCCRSVTASVISVTAATYGGNCGAAVNNRLPFLKSFCDNKETCSAPWDSEATGGDPANGCEKDLSIVYDCGDQGPYTSLVNPEANAQIVYLSCTQRVFKVVTTGTTCENSGIAYCTTINSKEGCDAAAQAIPSLGGPSADAYNDNFITGCSRFSNADSNTWFLAQSGTSINCGSGTGDDCICDCTPPTLSPTATPTSAPTPSSAAPSATPSAAPSAAPTTFTPSTSAPSASPTTVDPDLNTGAPAPPGDKDDDDNNEENDIIIFILVGATGLLLFCATVVLVYRRKKRKEEVFKFRTSHTSSNLAVSSGYNIEDGSAALPPGTLGRSDGGGKQKRAHTSSRLGLLSNPIRASLSRSTSNTSDSPRSSSVRKSKPSSSSSSSSSSSGVSGKGKAMRF